MSELQDNRDNQDEALVWQMRCLTANYLESHQDYFQSFCQVKYEQLIKDVLTMGKEADGLGIGPLQVVLKIKIDIVTIDRNYAEAFQFDQMKIQGKCPLIYILFKPGHYDIIYSREQTDADGFNEYSETFTKEFVVPLNYRREEPGSPFFVQIIPTGQECPLNEFKDFRIQFPFSYISTKETQNTQEKLIQIAQENKIQLQKCEKCQIDFEQDLIIRLQCGHQFCKLELEDKIYLDSNNQIFVKQFEKGQKPSCFKCQHTLTYLEIQNVIGKDKYDQAYLLFEQR